MAVYRIKQLRFLIFVSTEKPETTMKALSIFLISFFLFAEDPAPTKPNPERKAIEAVIQKYFDGWLTGNAELVGEAMHASCHLKFVRDGEIVIRDRENYLSGFRPRDRRADSEGRILDIDITRTAAKAKIELETPGRLYTDYFNLLKIGDQWYITDKVSTSIAK